MAKTSQTTTVKVKEKVSRPGVHSKAKTSKLKSSKNYKKLNKGQGWKIVETKPNTCVEKKLMQHVLTMN